MQLDNEHVFEGDSLYDIGVGHHGTVTEVGTDQVAVQFRGCVKHTYSCHGRRRGMAGRMLFWHDPVIIPPTRDQNFHIHERNALLGVATALRQAWHGIQGCNN